MDRVKLRDAALFAKNEDYRVVAKAAAWMDGDGRRLVDHKHLAVVHQDLQRSADHGGLVAVYRILHEVIVLCGQSENL